MDFLPPLGWMPSMSDAAPWLQVFLPSVYQITGVITQGCGNIDGWTADYTIKYSQNRSLDYLTDYVAMGNIKVRMGLMYRESQYAHVFIACWCSWCRENVCS